MKTSDIDGLFEQIKEFLEGKEPEKSLLFEDQLALRKRAEKKIPQFLDRPFLLLREPLEQCSSQYTALYKTSFMKGERVIDCTGGLGIDTFFFATMFTKAYYCESSTVLSQICAQNCKTLGVDNIYIYNDNSMSVLKSESDSFDWIYIDPARRDSHSRYVSFQNCEPDIIQCKDLLLSKGKNICIKASPIYDITLAKKEIPEIDTFIIVSVDGECKEILCIIHEQKKDVTVKSVTLSSRGNAPIVFERAFEEVDEKNTGDLCSHFYEPDSAIIKSGCTSKVVQQLKLHYVNKTVDFLTGDYIENFPGRSFSVITSMKWQRKRVRHYLEECKIRSAVVNRRDFPMSTEEIKKMLSLSDGGKDYLFFTKNNDGQKIMIHCIRVA